MRSFLLSLAFLAFTNPLAALVIYKNGASLITGTWNGNGTLTQTSANQPYEGTQHYSFAYTTVNTWAGYGLNMDNWYNGPAVDLSGFTHLRIAYRGLSAGHVLNLQLRQGQNIYGAQYQVGGSTGTYTLLDIPMTGLVGSSGINLAQISELFFSVTSAGTTTGTVYVDAIEAINIAPPPPSTAWDEADAMGKGFNLSNWLEAYWLLPFGTYPEVPKYVRADISFLKNAGFKTIRLPVIFEKLANANPPYTLNTNHVAYALVDSAIVWANAFNMNLIIDNHHGYELTNANFQTETARKCAIWRQLAQRYGGLSANRFFFELYNEATPDISNANLRTVMKTVMDTIRLWDANQVLIVGGNGWNSANGLTSSEPYYDDKVIYTFHNYDPYFFTHQGFSWSGLPAGVTFPQGSDLADLAATYQSVKDWSNNNDMPVFLGEFGASSWADATSRCAWIDAQMDNIDLHDFPWAYWSPKYSSDDFGFFQNSILSATNAIPCFVTAMGLNLQAAPVEFVSAYVRCDAGTNHVAWTANVSDPSARYEVEHSQDGSTWYVAGETEARYGTHSYQFEEKNTEWRFYRLRYVYPGGTATYSPMVRAACTEDAGFQAFPNPTQGEVTLSISMGHSRQVAVQVFDAQGRLLQRTLQDGAAGQNQWKIDLGGLPQGLYFIALQDEVGLPLGTVPVLRQP